MVHLYDIYTHSRVKKIKWNCKNIREDGICKKYFTNVLCSEIPYLMECI